MFSAPIDHCATCPMGVALPARCPLTPSLLPSGARLCEAGDRLGDVYLIREGLMALHQGVGTEAVLAVRGPRSILGVEALKTAPASFRLQALTDVRLCSAPATTVQLWLEHSEASVIMIQLLLGGLIDAQADLRLTAEQALVRLARFLLASVRASHQTRAQRLQKRTIAAILGMRAETLSRCLRQLSKLGLVDCRQGVRVLDSERLAALIEAGGVAEAEGPLEIVEAKVEAEALAGAERAPRGPGRRLRLAAANGAAGHTALHVDQESR